MRVALVSAMTILAAAFAFGEKEEAATYVVGDLKQVQAGSAGILSLYPENATFRAGDTTLLFDYASVTRAEIGPNVKQSMRVPLYKPWKLRKNAHLYNPPTQYVTIDFKTDSGEAHSMTFEVAEDEASVIVDIVQGRRDPDHDPPKPSEVYKAPPSNWWGDSLWKTNRNSETWEPKPEGSDSK